MELVDKHGKLFGKANVVDVLIVVALILGAYTAYTFLFGLDKPTYVTILSKNQPSWVYKNIRVGDKELGYFTGRELGEVVGIEQIPSFQNKADLVVVMKIDASNKNGVLFYKDVIINIGKPIKISLGNVYLNGQIIGLGETKPQTTVQPDEKIIEARAEGVSSEVAAEFFNGKTIEQGGQKIFEILDIEKIATDYKTYNIVMKFLIETKRFDERLVFGGQTIRKGDNFEIDDGGIQLKTKIVDVLPFEEKNKRLAETKTFKIVDLEAWDFPLSTARYLLPGSGETDSDMEKVSEIKEISGEKTTDGIAHVRLKAEIQVEIKKGVPMYKNEQLNIGDTISINIPNATISGAIRGIYNSMEEIPKSETFYKTVTLKARNINPWTAGKIAAGDTETSLGGGIIISKILEKSEKPAEIITTSDSGQILKTIHPENKDLDLKAELLLKKDEYGQTTFKGKFIKTGYEIFLSFDNANITAAIVDIK
ncbi:MAG: hypothetical protein HY394_04575 [Candidatus Diapherotrites archaeon]|nr:hypothetical protein [Candidatus Diapherotrites archaeon]